MFNSTIFASSEYQLQAISITQSQVAKIYSSFSQKINIRLSSAESKLSAESKRELAQISRDIEANFSRLEVAVRSHDRVSGLNIIAIIKSDVSRINSIIAASKMALADIPIETPAYADPVTTPSDILYYSDAFE